MTPARRWMTAGVSLGILLGAIVRVVGISKLSLWFDEGYSAWVIDHSAAEMLRLIRADTAPPLYYLLLHAWADLFGRSEAGLRSLSAICGIGAIGFVAGIAHRLYAKSPAAVVAATWLFALNWFAVDYSQEARSYEMTVLLAAAMLYFVVSYLARPHWVWPAAFVAAAACGLYANNFMIFYVGAIGAAGFVFPSSVPLARRIRAALIVGVCLALIYMPWISSLRSQVQRVQQDFWLPRPTIDLVCQEVTRLCGVEHFWSWDQYVHGAFADVATGLPRLVAGALTCGILFFVIVLRGDQRRVMAGLVTAALLPVVAALVYSIWRRSIFLPAAFVPSTAFMSVLLAGPLAWSRSRAGAGLVMAAVLLSAVNLCAFENERTKENWRSAAAIVQSKPPVEHRLIVFVANEGRLPFDYYYHRRAGETETGAPRGFLDVDPPRTQLRVLSDSDLAPLREKIAAEPWDDLILIVAHAGWPDRGGVFHSEYSDPRGLTVKMLLGEMRVLSRVDLPDDSSRHQITIWRLAPR